MWLAASPASSPSRAAAELYPQTLRLPAADPPVPTLEELFLRHYGDDVTVAGNGARR